MQKNNYKIFMEYEGPLYELYNLNPNNYKRIEIENLDSPVRVKNCLRRGKINTVDDLLRVSPQELFSLRNFGKGCLDWIDGYLSSLLLSDNGITPVDNDCCEWNVKELRPYRNQIMNEDFSFIENISFSKDALKTIAAIRESFAWIDTELIEKINNDPEGVSKLANTLKEFTSSLEEKTILQRVKKSFPKFYLNYSARTIAELYTKDVELRNLICNSEDFTLSLGDLIETISVDDYERLVEIEKLSKWSSLNVGKEINDFFENTIKQERTITVISRRAQGQTLEEVGNSFDVTRERIRQLEKKAYRAFVAWNKRKNIVKKIVADLNQNNLLACDDIKEYLGDTTAYKEEFVYLLCFADTDEIHYDKQFGAILIAETSVLNEIKSYVSQLPDIIHESQLDSIFEERNWLPRKLILTELTNEYKKTGDIYHRVRLSLEMIYRKVLEEYYPNGLHVYNHEELEIFKKHVYEISGIDISEKTDRGLSAILGRVGFLCGRGIYKASGEGDISSELATEIHEYINNSKAPIFLTNTIYTIFEEELLSEGIDNKYHMEAILRSLYDNEWFFRRDYISKDRSQINIYSSVTSLVKESKYPISKEDIQNKFPGLPDIVLNTALNDTDIINLFGVYIHSSKLKLSDADIDYLENVVNKFLEVKSICHCAEIYDYIKLFNPTLLSNNYVNYPFSLYSLLEHLFSDQYSFSRPFVAKIGETIENAKDVLKRMVVESERIHISEVVTFARENKLQLYSIREFADSCNETHFIINDDEMASVTYIGITREIAETIEAAILQEISSTTPIHDLNCLNALPKLNVEWSTWLIYSAIKKWGTKLEVGASAKHFKDSYPLIAPAGMLVISEDSVPAKKGHSIINTVDDLSDIDSLIEGTIFSDLEELYEL